MLAESPEGPLWLLSDAPEPFTVVLQARGAPPQLHWQLLDPQPLQGVPPRPFDGEALVMTTGSSGPRWWMASEGRLNTEQPAELLQLGRPSAVAGFRLLDRTPLPMEWQPQAGRGLRPNGGPEALVPLPGERLLIAAETPLQQDPRIGYGCCWPRPAEESASTLGTTLAFEPAIGAETHWGLTELLGLPGGRLLALWRGYAPTAGGPTWHCCRHPPSTAPGPAR